jgi:hypothetical protein
MQLAERREIFSSQTVQGCFIGFRHGIASGQRKSASGAVLSIEGAHAQ